TSRAFERGLFERRLRRRNRSWGRFRRGPPRPPPMNEGASKEKGMKLEGSYDVAAPRAKVWEAFLDPKQLRKAIPGCEKLEALGPDEFKATLKIGVAAVKGTFEGKVRLADKKPPESYRLVAEGSGGP